jgi:hypothetical protein
MSGRMIIDAHAASKRLVSTKAFYLADGGIQYARRYLWNGNSAETTLGPVSIGDGTVTIEITHEEIYYGSIFSTDVYRIISTATVGPATRSVVEMRLRGGGSDKEFLLWQERVADEEE